MHVSFPLDVHKDLRSPVKLMNEAKRIVDGGVELLDTNLTRFAEIADPTDEVIIKGKDKPQERRQGLGIVRKRARFSLKPSARWRLKLIDLIFYLCIMHIWRFIPKLVIMFCVLTVSLL